MVESRSCDIRDSCPVRLELVQTKGKGDFISGSVTNGKHTDLDIGTSSSSSSIPQTDSAFFSSLRRSRWFCCLAPPPSDRIIVTCGEICNQRMKAMQVLHLQLTVASGEPLGYIETLDVLGPEVKCIIKSFLSPISLPCPAPWPLEVLFICLKAKCRPCCSCISWSMA